MLSASLDHPDHTLTNQVFTDKKTGARALLLPLTDEFDYTEFRLKTDTLFEGATFLNYLLDERDALAVSNILHDNSYHDVSEVEAYKVASKAAIKGRYGNSGSYTGLLVYRQRNNRACICTAVLDVPRGIQDGLAESIYNYADHANTQGYLRPSEERRLNTSKALATNQLALIKALFDTAESDIKDLFVSRRRYLLSQINALEAVKASSYE